LNLGGEAFKVTLPFNVHQLIMAFRLPPEICEFRFILGSGPGGQHVNKTASTVELRVTVSKLQLPPAPLARLKEQQAKRISKLGELVIQSGNHRSQLMNRQEAVSRVEKFIDEALIRPKSRVATRPTLASKRRRLEGKKVRGSVKSQRKKPSW
jgi:ribosome-associated protein